MWNLDHWPIWFICSAMIASAVIDWWMFKVPNWLTFPIILSGWFLGLLHTIGTSFDAGNGGIWESMLGTLWGFLFLLPIYAIRGMGGGDVKMTMGFGSWIGAFYAPWSAALHILFYSFCTGVIVGGVIGLAMILVRRQFAQNWQNTREIVGDIVQSSSISEIAEKSEKRKSRWHRLPYGVPLCIGFVGYLVVVEPTPRTEVAYFVRAILMHLTSLSIFS